MKQLSLIFFFLVGLIMLEVGCCRCGPTPADHAFIDSFNAYITPVVSDSLLQKKLKFDNVVFNVTSNLDFVKSKNCSSNYSAFACSCDPPEIILHTTIDSVGVFGTLDGNTHELTELIAIDFRPYDYINYNPQEFTDLREITSQELNDEVLRSRTMRFAMKYPPSDTLNTTFTFKFYHNAGEWFEAVTDSIVVLP